MKSGFLFLLLIIFSIVLSCEKKTDDSDIIVTDSILFHDFIPDILVTSTREYGPDSFNACLETPNPIDSTAVLNIDINDDLIDDFELSVQHWCYRGSGSSYAFLPCLVYENYRTTISSKNDSNKICYKGYGIGLNEFLNGEIISSDSIWREGTALYYSSGEMPFSYIPSNPEFYMGYKIYKDNRYYYGWILINISNDELIIKEYAINLSENQKIIAGQKI